MSMQISERQLRERSITLVRNTREAFQKEIPLRSLLVNLGLKLKEVELPEGKDGAYIESSKTILINRKITSSERRTFTAYHEITHHLIRFDDDLYSELHEFSSDNDVFNRTLESLCNIGAAEFLLPREYVRDIFRDKGFSIGHLKSLCELRGASIPAAAIQLAQYAAHQCYIVVCESGVAPNNSHQTELVSLTSGGSQLYILYAASSPSAKYSISRYTVIRKGHIIHDAHDRQITVTGVDDIPFKSGKSWKVPCEAMFYRAKTIAAFNATEPISNAQPKLFD